MPILSDNYTGFRTIEVPKNLIDQLYQEGKIEVPDKRIAWYPNMYVELVSLDDQSTGLGKYKEDKIIRVDPKRFRGILKPKNREQIFAVDAMMDQDIKMVALSGKPGSGKSILALMAAIYGIDKKLYNRVILTKPMTQITKHKLGSLPGITEEKFHPYLLNYLSNIQQLVGKSVTLEDMESQYYMEFIPLQLFLGASFINTFLVVDEAQSLTQIEMGAILTRAGEGSKVIVLGDYLQIHDPINQKDQGLRRLANDKRVKQSPITAVVELQKCERSELAALMAEVFEC